MQRKMEYRIMKEANIESRKGRDEREREKEKLGVEERWFAMGISG